MAEVIRWSTGEKMMNTAERGTRASLSRCLACLASLLAHSTALIYAVIDGAKWDSTTGVVLRIQCSVSDRYTLHFHLFLIRIIIFVALQGVAKSFNSFLQLGTGYSHRIEKSFFYSNIMAP